MISPRGLREPPTAGRARYGPRLYRPSAVPQVPNPVGILPLMLPQPMRSLIVVIIVFKHRGHAIFLPTRHPMFANGDANVHIERRAALRCLRRSISRMMVGHKHKLLLLSLRLRPFHRLRMRAANFVVADSNRHRN